MFNTPFGKIEYLDGWRGLAIIAVLSEHFTNIEGVDLGRLGVDLFFVLSGLLMANILFIKRTPLKKFYKRRVSRIIPLAFLFLSVIYAAGAYIGQSFSLTEVVSSFLFLRTYVPLDPHIWQAEVTVSHFWSLNVEEHCYLLMGIMTLFLRDSLKAGIALMLLGCAAVATDILYIYVQWAPSEPEIRTETASAPLLLSAGYFLLRQHLKISIHPLLPVLALLLAASTYLHAEPWWTRFAAPFLLAFSINNLEHTYHAVKQLLSWKPLRFMGVWSYSVYVWQQPFYVNREIMWGSGTIVLVMVASLASFYLFEQPIRAFMNRRW